MLTLVPEYRNEEWPPLLNKVMSLLDISLWMFLESLMAKLLQRADIGLLGLLGLLYPLAAKV